MRDSEGRQTDAAQSRALWPEPRVFEPGHRPTLQIRLKNGSWVRSEAIMVDERSDGTWYWCRWTSSFGVERAWFGPTRTRAAEVDLSD